MNRVDVSDRAVADLLGHVDYVSDYSRAAAEQLLTDFEDVCAQLRVFPESGARSRVEPVLRLVRRRGYLYMYAHDPGEGVLLLRIFAGRLQREPR
ncbi:MAG: type II toxin-antitoxin system RelE/ParE family toxin [Dehalococcoidia bacterium]|nr:type II toxin-antitoxin system RelE/ParE family toxin [Dehalococcoidia bacterium]